MILLTGANGFIGSCLLKYLNQKGQSDILITDYIEPSDRAELLKNSKFKEFVSAGSFLQRLDSYQFSAVLHIGACSSTVETNWDYLKEVNLDYSKTLFKYCAKHQIPFLYASSAAVYGDGTQGFDDSDNTQKFTPLNLYGRSKSEFDIWAEAQETKPPQWCGFRYFNVFGPNEYFKGSMASVVYKAFKQIQSTGEMTLFKSHNSKYGDGEQMRDFVYIKDILDWTWTILNTSSFPSGIYNMGFGKARTWLDLGRAIFKATGKPEKINWIDIPPNIRDQYQYFTCANINRLTSGGLNKPNWSLELAVEDYIKNYLIKEDPYFK